VDSAWLDLVNSDCLDYLGRRGREDRLENPVWLKRFLARWKLSRAERSRPETRKALRELRDLIRGIVDRILAGRSISRKQWDSLNSVLAGAPCYRHLEVGDAGHQMRLLPASAGIKGVLAGIAASFAHVFTHGDPSRIKLCQNPDCLWVVYDESKNRSRRWCEGATGCGNLIKVRRHRARKKKAAGRSGSRTSPDSSSRPEI
jgi:predicted RNA-binding Zn ribbon-like protein